MTVLLLRSALVLCSVERDSFEGDLERETKTKKDEYQKEGGEGRRRRRRRTTRRERERERERWVKAGCVFRLARRAVGG